MRPRDGCLERGQLLYARPAARLGKALHGQVVHLRVRVLFLDGARHFRPVAPVRLRVGALHRSGRLVSGAARRARIRRSCRARPALAGVHLRLKAVFRRAYDRALVPLAVVGAALGRDHGVALPGAHGHPVIFGKRRAVVAAVLVDVGERVGKFRVFGVRGAGRLGVEQVDLVVHRGVGSKRGAAQRAQRHVAFRGEDIGRAYRRIVGVHDRLLAEEVVVLVDVILGGVAVGFQVEVEALEIRRRAVVVGQPEIARVLAVFDDAPIAVVREILALRAPAVAHEPRAIFGRDVVLAVVEVGLGVVVVEAHYAHGVVGIVGVGIVVGGRVLVVVAVKRSEGTGHGPPALTDLLLDGGNRSQVGVVVLAVLQDGRVRQGVAVFQVHERGVPQGIIHRPVGVDLLAVCVLVVARPVQARNGLPRLFALVNLFLGEVELLGLAGCPACLGHLALDQALLVAIRRVRLEYRTNPCGQDGRAVDGLASQVERCVGIVAVAVEALACLRGADNAFRRPAVAVGRAHELQLGKVDAALGIGRARLGQDARLAGCAYGKRPAGAPGMLLFHGGDHAVGPVAVAIGVAQVVAGRQPLKGRGGIGCARSRRRAHIACARVCVVGGGIRARLHRARLHLGICLLPGRVIGGAGVVGHSRCGAQRARRKQKSAREQRAEHAPRTRMCYTCILASISRIRPDLAPFHRLHQAHRVCPPCGLPSNVSGSKIS